MILCSSHCENKTYTILYYTIIGDGKSWYNLLQLFHIFFRCILSDTEVTLELQLYVLQSISHQNPWASQNHANWPSFISIIAFIMAIDHHAFQPSCKSAVWPVFATFKPFGFFSPKFELFWIIKLSWYFEFHLNCSLLRCYTENILWFIKYR